MRLNPPPVRLPPEANPQKIAFLSALVESVRLLFEANRVKYQTVTAGTTHTQAGATQLTGTINNIDTVANASDAVRLPPASENDTVELRNTGANAAAVWPASGDSIDGGAANAVDTNTLAANASRRYFAITSSAWITLSDG